MGIMGLNEELTANVGMSRGGGGCSANSAAGVGRA